MQVGGKSDKNAALISIWQEQIALVPIEHVHLSYVPESRGGRFNDH
jgi:hypothetical protein